MSPDQYRAYLDKFGFSQQSAADFLKISLRTSHAYANGETDVPEAIALLFRLMHKFGQEPKQVSRLSLRR